MSEHIENKPTGKEIFSERQYIYRILYDIGYGNGNVKAMDAYMVVNPTCEAFMQSAEYEDCTTGLYESVEMYINEHDWNEQIHAVDTLSEDFRCFEDFVTLYKQLCIEGKEFTIDDKCFDNRLQNKFTIALTDTEMKSLGLDGLDTEECKIRILSALRKNMENELVFRDNETELTDIYLPLSTNDCFSTIISCEDEVYRSCLLRISDESDGNKFSAAYIASNSELKVLINRSGESEGVLLEMTYMSDDYIVPISRNESKSLYDLVDKEILRKFGFSISQHYKDLALGKTKKDSFDRD